MTTPHDKDEYVVPRSGMDYLAETLERMKFVKCAYCGHEQPSPEDGFEACEECGADDAAGAADATSASPRVGHAGVWLWGDGERERPGVPVVREADAFDCAGGAVMGASKHTPGPWTVNVVSRKGHFVMAPTAKGNTFSVARVYRDAAENGDQEANLRLIAAAPDLLRAVKLACDADLMAHSINVSDWAMVIRLAEEHGINTDLDPDVARDLLADTARSARYTALAKAGAQ